jgi:ribosomal protein L37AE/L43A
MVSNLNVSDVLKGKTRKMPLKDSPDGPTVCTDCKKQKLSFIISVWVCLACDKVDAWPIMQPPPKEE